jgi:hypothetical protein
MQGYSDADKQPLASISDYSWVYRLFGYALLTNHFEKKG